MKPELSWFAFSGTPSAGDQPPPDQGSFLCVSYSRLGASVWSGAQTHAPVSMASWLWHDLRFSCVGHSARDTESADPIVPSRPPRPPQTSRWVAVMGRLEFAAQGLDLQANICSLAAKGACGCCFRRRRPNCICLFVLETTVYRIHGG